MLDESLTLPSCTKVAQPQDDVKDVRAVKADYGLELGRVDRQDANLPEVYRDPRRFFETTYMSPGLRDILKDVLGALCQQREDRVLQLQTPFGGGKTHTLAALLHAARSRESLRDLPALDELPDPGAVRVAVLSAKELSPGKPLPGPGGVETRTLWGELAVRLAGPPGYEILRYEDEHRSAPGSEEIAKLLNLCHEQGAAVLVLLDEVLDYIVRAKAIPVRDGTLAQQTTAFIDSLVRCVAGDPRAVLVYSLQQSNQEALGDEGLLKALEKLVARQEARRTPVTDDEIGAVVRKRLFKDPGPKEVREQVARAYARLHREWRLAAAATDEDRRQAEQGAEQLQRQIEMSYPFHPALLRLMYERWSSLPSYQRTRGALSFLATVTHVLYRQGHDAPLIGPGDIPLFDHDVRSEFFKQVSQQQAYTPVLDTDVCGSAARCLATDQQIGRDSPALAQARVGSKLATSIALYSFGVRRDDARGVLDTDLVAACLRPGVEAPVVLSALDDLKGRLLYIYSGGGRYRFETMANLTKVVEEREGQLAPEDVVARMREVLKKIVGERTEAVLWPESPGAVPDEHREFLVVYLPLEWAELTPEEQKIKARDWVQRKGSGDKRDKRSFRNGLSFAIPGKAQADRARERARNLMALEAIKKELSTRKSVSRRLSAEDEEMLADAASRIGSAQKEMEAALRGLYGLLILPGRGGEDHVIGLKEVELAGLAAHSGVLHRGVLDLLKDKVFASLKDDKFVELCKLSAEQPFRTAADAVNAFYALLDYPKITSEAVLRKALSEAVAKNKLGYVAQGSVEEGTLRIARPDMVRMGAVYPPEEFDLGSEAYVLLPDHARALREGTQTRDEPRQETEDTAAEGGSLGVSPPIARASDEGPGGSRILSTPPVVDLPGAAPAAAPAVPPAPASGLATQSECEAYILEATATSNKQWLKLGKAISELTGMSLDKVEVTVKVVAQRRAGFDRGKLRNQIEEPLSENDVQFTAEMGKAP